MLKKIIKCLTVTILAIGIIIVTTNLIILSTTNKKIITVENKNITNYDCILILGAGVRNGYPTPMLEDRLLEGVSLYQKNSAPKILVSGDHQYKKYDEVNIMKNYLINKKIPTKDIFMDHAGISTYDSIYRAKYIFKAQKIIIVTQKYHLPRALYIAKQLDIEAHGIASNPREYANQPYREVREILARTKDFFKCLLKEKSVYLGNEIPIYGDGNITND